MAGLGDVTMVIFGAALRTHREKAGLSLRQLGRRIHYDHTRLSRAENGQHLPAEAYVLALDEELGTGDLLTQLRKQAAQPGPPTPGPPAFQIQVVGPAVGRQPTITVELRMPDGRIRRMAIPRRQFAELLAAAGLTAMLSEHLLDPDETARLRHAIRNPRAVDAQVAGYFVRQLAEHYTADKMLGPAVLVPILEAQIATIDQLRREAPPAVRHLLTPVHCQYAEFLGWLHQDADDTPAATAYTTIASELAQISGDPNLIAYMLIRHSNILYRHGDTLRATDLASAAQHHHDRTDRKVLALASQQEARGWAMANDYDRCAASLDRATDLLDNADPETDSRVPTYIHHYNLDTLEDQTATCYRDLGRTHHAIAIFQRKVDQLPAGHHRDRGYRLAKLAVAYAHANQPHAAATTGLQALTLARQTSSARTETELHPLTTTLASARANPDVATFLDALTTR